MTGEALREQTSFEEIALRLKAASDLTRKHGSYDLIRKRRSSTRSEDSLRGIGFAFGYQDNGSALSSIAPEAFTVEMTLLKDLSLEISTSAIAGDEGIRSIWKSTAAKILAFPEVKVRSPERHIRRFRIRTFGVVPQHAVVNI